MAACQQFQWSQGGTQQLTAWMGFHGCMLAIPMEPRRHTATHKLDRNFMAAYQQFQWSQGGTQQLTLWMGFHNGISAIQMDPRRHKATHSLDGISWLHVSHSNEAQEVHSNSHPRYWVNHLCCQFEISHVTSLLPVVHCSEFAFLSF